MGHLSYLRRGVEITGQAQRTLRREVALNISLSSLLTPLSSIKLLTTEIKSVRFKKMNFKEKKYK